MTARSHLRQLGDLAWGSGERRAATRRDVVFSLLTRTVPAVAVDSDGMRFYVETADQAVGRQTFINGSYDLEAMRTALSLIEAQANVSLRGRDFIDVGANIGTTVVPACKIFGASGALALEPSSRNLTQLRVNVAANGLQDVVKVLPVAVSNTSGELELELNAVGNQGDNRLRIGTAKAGAWQEDSWETETVRVITLDEVFDQVDDPAVLWVDTQGHEAHVLAGATSAAAIPAVIEYWPYGLRRMSGLEQLHDLLLTRYSRIFDIRSGDASKGMRPRELTAQSLRDLPLSYPGPGQYTDLVLIP